MQQTNGVSPVTFTVARGGDERFDRTLTAEKPVQPTNAPPAFGIVNWNINSDEILTRPRPLKQVQDSVSQLVATSRRCCPRSPTSGSSSWAGP